MKKILILAFSLVWLLPANLSCSAVKVGDPRSFPSAGNAQGDLWGENQGDQIVFNWAYDTDASEYVVYRSTSASGPWAELGRMPDDVARTSGSKIDDTPDATLMDLCYKVEAVDATGAVIRIYEPMCVPKFVPQSHNKKDDMDYENI